MSKKKSINDGVPKVRTFEDFVQAIEKNDAIDTIRYSYTMSPFNGQGGSLNLVYAVLYSNREKRGYGGQFVSQSLLDKLKEHFTDPARIMFIET